MPTTSDRSSRFKGTYGHKMALIAAGAIAAAACSGSSEQSVFQPSGTTNSGSGGATSTGTGSGTTTGSGGTIGAIGTPDGGVADAPSYDARDACGLSSIKADN